MLNGTSEVSLSHPGYGGTQLPQLIGKGRYQMIMTAGMITADEAYRNGLANHVVASNRSFLEFCNVITQKKS
jgi:enoyl-CoA hydratase